MIGINVSHDILAALIAGLAVVMVPVIYVTKGTRERAQRVDMIALRERIDDATDAVDKASEIALGASERRAAEHDRILHELKRIQEDLTEIKTHYL